MIFTSKMIDSSFNQNDHSMSSTPHCRLVLMLCTVAASVTARNLLLTTVCFGTALLTSASQAQMGPPSNGLDTGALFGSLIGLGNDIQPSFQAVRMPSEMTQRCDNSGGFDPDDLYQYNYGTAGIGLPFQASTVPIFGAATGFGAPAALGNFLGRPDILTNPGTHYNSLISLKSLGSGTGLNINNPTQTVTGPGRFGGGSFAISQGVITGSVTDRKGPSFDDMGASYVIVTFEETYEVTGSGSLGGALAFDITLPKSVPLLNQIPGAAAVALTTTMVTPSDAIQLPGGDALDAGCFRIGSIVASVSEGVDDGIDNLNTGPQENFFGNSDVGKIVDGDFGSFLGLTGGVTISSKSINMFAGITPVDEVYEVAGTWNTPTLNFINGPTKVTLRHTLTMIADPGANIQLRALTQSEYDILPHNADVFVFASGTVIPEPSSLSLMSLLLLGLGSMRRSRCSPNRIH